MRVFLILLFLLTVLVEFNSFSQEDSFTTITVRLDRKLGRGPYFQHFGKFSTVEKNPSGRFYGLNEMATDIPKAYDGFLIGTLSSDFLQMAWSAIKNGKLDSTRFYNGWFGTDSPEDLKRYTSEMVDTEVSIAFGMVEGEYAILVDTNNDESFADEEAHFFPKSDSLGFMKGEESLFTAQVERFVEGKVRQDSMTFTFNPFMDIIGVSTREYSEGVMRFGNETKYFYLSNGFNGVHHQIDRMDLIVTNAAFSEANAKEMRTAEYKNVLKHEDVFEVNGIRYMLDSVNEFGTELYLRKMPSSGLWHGTQLGAIAPQITAETIRKKEYTLSNGKFTMLDFWGTWCAPCVDELPYLYDADLFFKDDNFELVGIANDKVEKVEEFIAYRKLGWQQIVQKEGGPILEAYKIRGYPSTFLIDPKGKVISSNTELRSRFLIWTLQKELSLTKDELRERVNRGNVIVQVADAKYSKVQLKGELTNKVGKPLYQISPADAIWTRGLNLEPGRYEIQVDYTENGSINTNHKMMELVVTGEPKQVITLALN